MRRRRGCQRRSGLVLVAALVCLLIVTSIVGSMLQSALRARRQLHAERDRRQTELLLAAGASRAAARLASEPEYRGDAWNLPAEEIVGLGEGRVTTEISRNNDNEPWQLHVVAEYSTGRDLPIRRSQTFQIPSVTIPTQE
jgi:Tfp pilus assembly protein PilX